METNTNTKFFAGIEGAPKPPTKKHRPAVWECMLGTVYAMNDELEVRYFDYDHAAARAFAGVTPERDPRIARVPKGPYRVRYTNGRSSADEPRPGQMAVWVRR